MRSILGISAYYHDSAAALVQNGEIVAAAQEERFSRLKHDSRFPANAVRYCLDSADQRLSDLDCVVYYEKPLLHFDRLLETYFAFAPRGWKSFSKSMPVWLKEKLFLRRTLRNELARVDGCREKHVPRLLFSEHHLSHAASAFFPSPFPRAAVLCLDGVGEWVTTSAWVGCANAITPLWELHFPHSLGLLYSAFTYYLGFKVNSGEYKLMGLAPYGTPKFSNIIKEHLIDLKPDGTFRLNLRYFDYCTGLRMTNAAFDSLFGAPPRAPEGTLTQTHMDIAASIQDVTEEILLRMAYSLHAETGQQDLCLAGGVALNCVANGRLLREGPFRRVWIQPAAGDAGGAIGAAMIGWHLYLDQSRAERRNDQMRGGYLGPAYSREEVGVCLDRMGARYHELAEGELVGPVATLLAEGKIVGWFQGKMEFGPRALGARSILGDPRRPEMQSVMNQKIKFRESFRPFAPAVLSERAAAYFQMDQPDPYMMRVAQIQESMRLRPDDGDAQESIGLARLHGRRSMIPAVTHVDYSARVQTVERDTNPLFHSLIEEFERLTGCAVLVNTSFNVRGEPIVCSPDDAYRCFMRTEMDHLVVENYLLDKVEQPHKDADSWRRVFDLD